MIHFFKLIRPLNLFIIAFTMVMMRFFVVGESLLDWNANHTGSSLFTFPTSTIDFLLLVLSTMLIAGAGYMINDYFDIKIDRVNKPEKVIVGKFIKKRVAMLWHTLFNLIAVGIAIYLSIRYHNLWPLAIHLFTTFGLWMYSLSLKRKFLSGNLVISLMAALVVVLVGLFELPELWAQYGKGSSGIPFNRSAIIQSEYTLIIYASFAFLSTLIREIQKDLADMEGDQVMNCTTIPIVWGIAKTKRMVSQLVIVLSLGVLTIQILFLNDLVSTLFIDILVIGPILLSGYQCYHAKDRKAFLSASQWLKLSMFTAILFSIFLP